MRVPMRPRIMDETKAERRKYTSRRLDRKAKPRSRIRRGR